MNIGNFAPGFRAKISQLTQVSLYEEALQPLLVAGEYSESADSEWILMDRQALAAQNLTDSPHLPSLTTKKKKREHPYTQSDTHVNE